MSDLKELRRSRLAPPPRRWRNLYWVDEAFTAKCGTSYKPGLNVGAYLWPTKEIAEQKALDSVRGQSDNVTYLGAEQEPGSGG